MSTALHAELGAWLEPLLTQLRPDQVRVLARALAVELRTRQSQRIAAQRNPDGTSFKARRTRRRSLEVPSLRAQRRERDRVRAMFAKLRTGAHLKTYASAIEGGVQFVGRSARIARVHQFGLRDQPQPGGPEISYAARELLGWSDGDLRMLSDRLLDHLGNGQAIRGDLFAAVM